MLSTKPSKRGGAKDVARFRWPVVIRMNPVDVRTAAEFLVQGHTGQDRAPWVALAEHLVDHPRSALADALRTPLTINLARHAFPQAGTSAEKPLDLVSAELDTPRKITTRLMSLYLDRAYSTAGVLGTRAAARATERHARERATLTWLAARLGAERDIAWWRIPREVDRGSLRMRNSLAVAACVLAITLTGYVLTKWPEPWWTGRSRRWSRSSSSGSSRRPRWSGHPPRWSGRGRRGRTSARPPASGCSVVCCSAG
ncbi:hypothetical protein ACFQV2_13610 [Actinokineospora soli]|uniref:Uncharacterized protein n=1 Tax=Actinokineospora soli TaxID=1048753 RepID=A0ABW2TPE5_9PSEU